MSDSFLPTKEILKAIKGLESRLDHIEQKITKLMATSQEILALIAQIDSTTNELGENISAIAGRIQRIQEQIAGGLTASEGSAIAAALGSEVSDLRVQSERARSLGQDPENPIPG